MSKRNQQKTINTLLAMGVLVNAIMNSNGAMYAEIKTIRNRTRVVPLSIAIQYVNDMKKGRLHGKGNLDSLPTFGKAAVPDVRASQV